MLSLRIPLSYPHAGRLAMLLCLVAAACAPKSPRIPGPLAAMGRSEGVPSPAQPTLDAGDRPTRATARQPSKSKRNRETAIVEAARYYLEHPMHGFRDDCSGFVMAVYARAGRPIDGNTAAFYEQAQEADALHHRRDPRPGDLAFFDDTYDRNHNGDLDDELSHIAIVIEIDENGTMLLAHGGTSKGRTTMQMNLHHPDLRAGEEGQTYNDWLRVRRDSDPKGTPYLSGELWKAFATPDLAGSDSVASAEKN